MKKIMPWNVVNVPGYDYNQTSELNSRFKLPIAT